MSDRLTKLLAEAQKLQLKNPVAKMLSTAPLTAPPSTAGNYSVFGKTSELRATVEKIRAIEAANPTLAKFPATAFPAGNLCDKKALENAQRHLASIAARAPRKRFAALDRPAAAKAVTSPAKATPGRSAQDLLALDPDAQNRLIFAAMPLAARPLRDELRAAFKSAPAGLRTKFAAIFRNGLNAHERDLGPSISKAQFDQLDPRQKMDSIRAGIRIS